MSIFKYVILYKQLESLIESNATGTPTELAEKLHVTERQLYNYLRDMRRLGVNFKYDASKKSYVLLKDKSKIPPKHRIQ